MELEFDILEESPVTVVPEISPDPEEQETDSVLLIEEVTATEFTSVPILQELQYTNLLLTIILYVLIIWFIRKIIISIRGYFFGY